MKLISSASNPLISHLISLKKDKNYRTEQQRLLLEGINCITDLCKTTSAKRLIILSGTEVPPELRADEQIEVPEAIFKKLTSVKSPEGILAEFSMPQPRSFKGLHHIVVCDRVSDPGNVGTLIRTALSLGWEGVFLIEPSCDPFNDKALRAAKGATFHLPIQSGSWDDLRAIIQMNEMLPLVAALHGDSPEQYAKERSIALILGNEAQGTLLPQQFPHKSVSIPMKGAMESLNVAIAGAILMYELLP